MGLAWYLALLPLVAQTPSARVSQHMMLLEPTGTELNVSETLLVPGGGRVRVAAPLDAGTPEVRGAALRRLRPGLFELEVPPSEEARIDLRWSMPFVVPETLTGRILHDAPVRLVAPKDVKVTGSMLELNGVEPTTLAQIFTLKSASYALTIDGAGQLRTQQRAAAAEDGPSIEQIPPRVYSRLYWILGLTLGLLAIGFTLHYRASVES